MTPPGNAVTIQDFPVELRPDNEWYSKPIRLRAGQRATITAVSSHAFYGGVFARAEYVRRKSGVGPFEFPFGSDRAAFTDEIVVARDDDYYIVFRVGVFSRPQTIQVHWVVENEAEG